MCCKQKDWWSSSHNSSLSRHLFIITSFYFLSTHHQSNFCIREINFCMFMRLFPHRGNILLSHSACLSPMRLKLRPIAQQPPPSPSCPHPSHSLQHYPVSALGKVLTQDFIIFQAKYHCLAPICGRSLVLERLSPICSPKPSSGFNLGWAAILPRIMVPHLGFWFHT